MRAWLAVAWLVLAPPVLLLIVFLSGCAAVKPEAEPPIQLCAVQVVKIFSETAFVVRQQCEPEGTKT